MMDTIELLRYSLGTAFDILGQVAADLTQKQADWMPPGTAVAIGALYWHTIATTDQVVHGWGMGQAPLGQSAGWQDKVVVGESPQAEEGRPAGFSEVKVNLAEMHAYAKAVADASQGWLSTLAPEELDRKIDTPIGELNLAQTIDTFVIWHVNAHCGEIAALKGCQGARGYPF
jgi:hypothetical protein